MMKTHMLVMLLVAGMGLLPFSAGAEERKAAEVKCTAVEGQELVYDCMINLKGRKSGSPITGAEFMVGADMPSMSGAHNVRPVPAEPHGMPGMYRARIQLEMTGEWALKLDFTKPKRDRVVEKLHFGGVEGHGGHGAGMSHGDADEETGHGGHGEHEHGEETGHDGHGGHGEEESE